MIELSSLPGLAQLNFTEIIPEAHPQVGPYQTPTRCQVSIGSGSRRIRNLDRKILVTTRSNVGIR